jgi:hypothetical protein
MSAAAQPSPKEPSRPAREDRTAGSFLVRVWYEIREIDGSAPAFRGFIKNLHTGEERFVRDPENVSDQILRQMRDETLTPPEGQESSRHDH